MDSNHELRFGASHSSLGLMRSSISPRWLFCALVCSGLAGLRVAEAAELTPAEAELAKKFAGVAQWQGIWDVSVAGGASRANGGYHMESRYEATGHGTFTLERSSDNDEAARGVFKWQGKGEARGGGLGTFSESGQQGIGEEWAQEFGGTVEQERIELSLWVGKKSVGLHPGMQREEKTPLMRRTGRMVSSQSGGGNKVSPIDTNFRAPIDTWYLGSGDADAARRWQVVSNGPGVLAFSYESPAAGRSQMFAISGAGVTQRSRVVLFPVYEDLEVEVTIADYAKWRPLGSIADPTKPGNTLGARAFLKTKSGKTKTLPTVKSFRFELMDTSREPGVCLNWPLGAKDEDYDLRLAAAGTGGDVTARGQKLAVTTPPLDDEQRPFAEATIECFDFGARAELRVICELEDGRELIGLMKGEGGTQDLVRLPKMKGPDWIAEVWRKEKNVMNVPAFDDSEKVEGQKDNGDGFTLYEEYRGWVVNGKHVEGDPGKKDFFVLNLIGGDGQNGINLFEALSKLRVHSKLKRSEMSQTTRLMNGNHRDAPHRVDQHGVWVKTFTRAGLGDSGADTPMTKAGVAGRPGITKGVGILARGDTESIFNQPFNLPARDTIFAYDRAIAHELLHSVGVEHHGPDDTSGYSFSFIPPNVPENKVGRPHFTSGGEVVRLLKEDGHDLAAEIYPQYVAAKELLIAMGTGAMIESLYGKSFENKPPGSKALKDFADEYVEQLSRAVYGRNGMVGREHGVHSGDQDCVMRYYFAKFYDAKSAAEKTVYLVTPGTEQIGLRLCQNGAGTGVNAPGHLPQSRYGSAAGDAGNCFEQICPNDAIPPRKVKP